MLTGSEGRERHGRAKRGKLNSMPSQSGYCNQCKKLSPAHYEERGNAVLLVKNCPDCGPTETIVSTDPAIWHAKRQIDRLKSDGGCALDCKTCGHSHHPCVIFMDLTNRCNQDCPICIANIAGMGFKFEPPYEYFEQLLQYLAAMTPKPSVKLFGGEPTLHKDLFQIVTRARGLGLSTSIVTNGVRLADEAYCQELLATGVKIVFSFDGRDPKVYQTLRGDAGVYEVKLKALENIRKHRRSKVTIMCVLARGVNDHLIADLLQFCHERSDFINACDFIPLSRTWVPGTVAADGADITAMEDVEKDVAAAMPDGKLEFLPAGLTPFKTISKYLPIPRLTFAGAHPNCESIAFLISNGKEYVPVSDYLKGRSLYEVLEEVDRAGRETRPADGADRERDRRAAGPGALHRARAQPEGTRRRGPRERRHAGDLRRPCCVEDAQDRARRLSRPQAQGHGPRQHAASEGPAHRDPALRGAAHDGQQPPAAVPGGLRVLGPGHRRAAHDAGLLMAALQERHHAEDHGTLPAGAGSTGRTGPACRQG